MRTGLSNHHFAFATVMQWFPDNVETRWPPGFCLDEVDNFVVCPAPHTGKAADKVSMEPFSKSNA